MTLFLTLFAAGMLTILLPCILPLIPVVLGVSIAGRHRLRPLVTILGMLVSFVGFTFLLQVVLSSFVELADIIRISTYYILLLFGICFLTENRLIQIVVAILGGFFFWNYGWVAITIAETAGVLAVEIGGRIASRIQQLGADAQEAARTGLGSESLATAFIVGLTLGLVWVPCAGPALGFALTLVRDEPGAKALLALLAYGTGTALPLLAIGYGGQMAIHSVRALGRFSGYVKHVAGVLLILSALGFQYGWLMQFQTWLVEYTDFGMYGTELEERLFDNSQNSSAPSTSSSDLPRIAKAPEFVGLGPWHNSEPLTLAGLKGKVVLIDFWTYSCINCIRTLPYIREYWDKYKDQPFVLLGVHTPEFVFEKSEKNVADAIKRYNLTHPVAQDNDFGTWTAFSNRYWPAKYLIDAEGYIRYYHFGEGAYKETDKAIASLLEETGVTMEDDEGVEGVEGEEERRFRERSPETYLGTRSISALYEGSDELPLHHYKLVGEWEMNDGERQVLTSPTGEIHYRALASEVNLVLGLEAGTKPVTADIFIDGKMTQTITIDRHDLFNLFTGEYGEHDVVLKINGAGVAGYAYTFGS